MIFVEFGAQRYLIYGCFSHANFSEVVSLLRSDMKYFTVLIPTAAVITTTPLCVHFCILVVSSLVTVDI
jgi:hypothetical protein